MGLLKLSRNHKIEFDPTARASEIISSFEASGLIRAAYLFGSAVTGKMTIDSDLDLLLVFKNENELELAKKEILHTRQSIAIDWIFKTHSAFENEKNFGGISYEAFHFGNKIK